MPKPQQTASDGTGPLFERRYYIDIEQPQKSAGKLLREIMCDVEKFSPDLLADFRKQKGEPHELRVDDEFQIRILGPWNGTVRVSEIGKSYFEFVTLEGHPEAGRIRFSVRRVADRPNTIRFQIRSWARSRDGLVAFTYGTLGVGKRVQEQTWRTFCERVAEQCGGQPAGPVVVETVERPDQGPAKVERHA